ncbi:alpha/beta fold hydrolase, partial [Xanthomonas citri]|uniref:alpha/beta fold hydrolase n=1 Tax=Xanthomonas citri TaxID=346 RepID=UPI00107287FF
MHIDVIGHGPALVLLHGWALHGGVFAPLVERLAPHYQLHLVDLPGHGFSRDDSTPLALPYVVAEIAAATPPAVWLGGGGGGGV